MITRRLSDQPNIPANLLSLHEYDRQRTAHCHFVDDPQYVSNRSITILNEVAERWACEEFVVQNCDRDRREQQHDHANANAKNPLRYSALRHIKMRQLRLLSRVIKGVGSNRTPLCGSSRIVLSCETLRTYATNPACCK